MRYRDFQQRMRNVNRFEVIDQRAVNAKPGRIVIVYDADVEVAFQDNGRTFKVFLSDPGDPGKYRDEEAEENIIR